MMRGMMAPSPGAPEPERGQARPRPRHGPPATPARASSGSNSPPAPGPAPASALLPPLRSRAGTQDQSADGDYPVSGTASPDFAALARSAPADAQAGRHVALRGLHDVRNGLSRQVHLHHWPRSPRMDESRSTRRLSRLTCCAVAFVACASRPAPKTRFAWIRVMSSWEAMHGRNSTWIASTCCGGGELTTHPQYPGELEGEPIRRIDLVKLARQH